jgi:hypothetical protein
MFSNCRAQGRVPAHQRHETSLANTSSSKILERFRPNGIEEQDGLGVHEFLGIWR